jgi:hypothetical protein
MQLFGSCHCGAVMFSFETRTPYPYMRCYCSICRKTQGGGGYAINIMGEATSLEVVGRDSLSIYRARIFKDGKPTRSPGKRHFCSKCGSSLWVWDPRWPEWIYPFASAIDSPLPKPPETTHIMVEFAAPWVDIPEGRRDTQFAKYPDESIADWHARLGLASPKPDKASTPKTVSTTRRRAMA